jgi:hypothetical protein
MLQYMFLHRKKKKVTGIHIPPLLYITSGTEIQIQDDTPIRLRNLTQLGQYHNRYKDTNAPSPMLYFIADETCWKIVSPTPVICVCSGHAIFNSDYWEILSNT